MPTTQKQLTDTEQVLASANREIAALAAVIEIYDQALGRQSEELQAAVRALVSTEVPHRLSEITAERIDEILSPLCLSY